MSGRKNFWISVSLINLSLVALLGFGLRSKIEFSIPSINYKHLLTAHSHFAFGGWAGLALVTLMVYELLPRQHSDRKIYQRILWGTQISSLGMAFSFPFMGYALVSIIFSTLHILFNYLFAVIFLKDLARSVKEKAIFWLSLTGVLSLVVSSIGPFGLAYAMASKTGNANLQRDLVYLFLHFQYNGFFTLAALALFYNRLLKANQLIRRSARSFAYLLCASILPTLFLSLLWHNLFIFYVLAAVGCLFLILCLLYFWKLFYEAWKARIFTNKIAQFFITLSFLSLGLKLLLQIGPIIPDLGTMVYGDRPLIIGFLHLVFLGFLTLYILASFVEWDASTSGKIPAAPFLVFTFGIIANEFLLMLQGFGILLNTNSSIYNQLLWINSVILFIGAILMAGSRIRYVNFRTRHE